MTPPLDSLDPISVRPKPARREPDEPARILLAAADMIERDRLTQGWQVSHAIRMATEETLGIGPVKAILWFERTLGRLHRLDGNEVIGRMTPAGWAARCREAAELAPLENPPWPPQNGW